MERFRGRRGVFLDVADAACRSGVYERLRCALEIDCEIVMDWLGFEVLRCPHIGRASS